MLWEEVASCWACGVTSVNGSSFSLLGEEGPGVSWCTKQAEVLLPTGKRPLSRPALTHKGSVSSWALGAQGKGQCCPFKGT